ncbi:hypothetical protein HUW46_08694 [Amycolatopsis sp. CA-230715]|nr:phosphoribosyltransferase family protein [Amycolatopsis sp. CA-230715]QWF85240.1 hypothetical protein HUW46_08694 [Amycolatopsis sp. CA-230715]
MGTRIFPDRPKAGERLAALLAPTEWHRPLVLGLARGGVPVAEPVARRLGAPLEVAVARKIGAPGHPEFAVGAVTASGPATYDDRILDKLGLTAADLSEAARRERAEAKRREELYRKDLAPEPRDERDLILVDDGLATGATATAAVRSLRAENPRAIVFAAPVCAPAAAEALLADADDVVCAAAPESFTAVGEWYYDFTQTTDEDVLAVLSETRGRP